MFFSKWHYLLLNFKKKQMIAGDIISEIIKRMKFWGSRFPDATTSQKKDLQTKSCDLCQQVFFFLTYFFDTVDSQCLNSLR